MRGFTLGTAMASVGSACGELVEEGTPLPSDIRSMTENLANVTTGLAKLELLLKPVAHEAETHAAVCTWVVRSAAAGEQPSAHHRQALPDVFPAHRFPPTPLPPDAQMAREEAARMLRDEMERRLGVWVA